MKFDIAAFRADKWFINDQDVDADISKYLYEKTRDDEVKLWDAPICLYCNTSLDATEFEDITDDDKEWHNNQCYLLNFCHRCAYWEFRGYEAGNRCMDSSRVILVSSVAAKFQHKLPDGCSEELAQYLRRNPMHWHDLSPTRMETLVTDIFRANYQHCEAIHVGAPGDRGVDVVFIDSDGIRWLIQVKRRAKLNKA
ncbi:MAG TPA: restriction endonuclease, partial [Blastocatellia bacterium]|nr:restriction endonuclease [Blastocatellia bacterium]